MDSRIGWMASRGALILLSFLVTGCSFLIPRDKVYVSDPGARWVSAEVDLKSRASSDVLFAWLSEVAYPEEKTLEANCSPPRVMLDKHGWSPITEQLFRPDEIKSYNEIGLYFEIWYRASSPSGVVVSFGGTNLSSLEHLKANLRWFLQDDADTYSQVAKRFVPEFRERYRKELVSGRISEGARLYATGHSLGGGLAQLFAYSLPSEAPELRLKRVVVFNTSPVTAKNTLFKSEVKKNMKGVSIDRVYQVSDPLDFIRTVSAAVFPASKSDPATRMVRYNVVKTFSPITFHKIGVFACGLELSADQGLIDQSYARDRE
ncbi:lipase family protein [Variovorax sp.]|jgi:pimeloyl-ACP methyl ester carboxylesterase|uniref:lipase family protein n=1 Tax=Variovorax sp. TaxID=1871043 RepID=UPI0025E35645|nr:hypothetical protein [Variovorax sp.]